MLAKLSVFTATVSGAKRAGLYRVWSEKSHMLQQVQVQVSHILVVEPSTAE